MRVIFLFCGILCWLGQVSGKERQNEMERIRASYAKAPSDRTVCKAMIEELGRSNANTLHIAYLGAFRAIWAKHAINPITKLVTFNKGREHIEKAVLNDPENVEIRFVRFSIQKNCPSFLGYNTDIQKDRQFIEANKGKIQSPQLMKMIADILQK